MHEDIEAEINVIVSAIGSDLLDIEELDAETDNNNQDIDTDININEDATSDDDTSPDVVSGTNEEVPEAE